MNSNKYFIFIVVIFSFVLPILASNESICYKTITEIKYQEQEVPQDVLKDVPVRCKKWFDRVRKKECFEQQMFTEMVLTKVPVNVTREVKKCCPGYQRMEKKCIPVCTNICENSRCTAPETCTCNSGYTKFSTYRCVPYCEVCMHGRCVAPGACECYSGYEQTEDGCVPICDEPCNGLCVEPNVCIGHEATDEYYKTSTPIDVFSSTTSSATAISNHIEYNDESDYDNLLDSDSYESIKDLYVITTSTISTISTTPHSYIITSENPCESGLFPDGLGFCKLPCEIDCHYGTYYDGICLCNQGFKKAPNNECICEPYCENECLNGLCTGNNTCLCDDGYKLNPEDNFVCLDSNKCHCKNGDCTDNDHCNCWRGYKLEHSETNYHRCEPICGDINNPQGCVNGKCVAPYLCKCDDGFVQGPLNNYTCYADMDCSTCIEQDSLCLPACYTTASMSTKSTTESIEVSTVTEVSDTTDVSEEDYFNNDVLLYSPVEEGTSRIIVYILITCAAFLILLVLVLLALKRFNKSIDYDIDRREKSTNNVYFSPSYDAVEVEI